MLRSLRHGRTTVLISHRLDSIKNADVIVVIDDGRMTGQPTEFVDQPVRGFRRAGFPRKGAHVPAPERRRRRERTQHRWVRRTGSRFVTWGGPFRR